MPLTLESRARRMQVFHLPHDVFCRDRCTCAEVAVVVVAENPRTGERAPKYVRKKVPSSLTFLALERKPGLPTALLEVAEVKAAIGRGYLRIIEQTPGKPTAPAATENAPSQSPAPVPSAPSHSPTSAAAESAPSHSPAPATSAPSHSPAPAANGSSSTPATKPPGKEP